MIEHSNESVIPHVVKGKERHIIGLGFWLRFLLIEICVIFYFAFMAGVNTAGFLILSLLCIQILLLQGTFAVEKMRPLRIPLLLLLVLSVLVYVLTFQIHHPDWDVRHFFMDIQALRAGQSPYSGELSCKMNQNFVPTFALCLLLGNSFREFSHNMLRVNAATYVACAVMTAGSLVLFFRRTRLKTAEKVEVFLLVTALTASFYVFFKWNMVVGNISSWVAPLVFLLIWLHIARRWLAAGLVLGLAFTIKPFLAPVAAGYAIHMLLKKDKRLFGLLLVSFLFLVGTAVALEMWDGGLGFATYVEFFSDVPAARIPGMMGNISNISMPAAFMGFLRNAGIPIDPQTVIRLCSVLLLASLGAGAYLSRRSPEQGMPADHLVFYLMLSLMVSPIIWIHYFSWLLAPAVFIMYRLAASEDNRHLIPLFLLNCLILALDPVAWIGSLLLPVIYFLFLLSTLSPVTHAGQTSCNPASLLLDQPVP